MMAQLREWIQGLNLDQRLMIFPLIVIYQEMRILAENNHNTSQGLVCGMLFGASAALPFLWPLKLRLLYLLYGNVSFPFMEARLTQQGLWCFRLCRHPVHGDEQGRHCPVNKHLSVGAGSESLMNDQ
jgi:hypothetical protein